MKKVKELVLVLCRECRDAFERSGHVVHRTKNKFKEPCDICKRFGWEYKIKSGGERGE